MKNKDLKKGLIWDLCASAHLTHRVGHSDAEQKCSVSPSRDSNKQSAPDHKGLLLLCNLARCSSYKVIK